LITKGTLTGIVDRLVERGWVERAAHDSDRRCQIVRLTPSGEALFAQAFPAHMAHLAACFAGVSAADHARWQTALHEMGQLFKRRRHELEPALHDPGHRAALAGGSADFCGFPLGVYMQDLPLSPTKLQLYSYHKWIGITVLLLAGLRVVWRLTHRPPPLPDSVVRWQRQVSAAVHGLLYVLILAIPLSGWLMSSAKGFPVVWFGVMPLPDLVGKDKALASCWSGYTRC